WYSALIRAFQFLGCSYPSRNMDFFDWHVQHSSCTFAIENSVFYSAWRKTISNTIELLHFALKLVIQYIISCLWCHKNCQRHILKLARLACIVIDNGCAVWTKTA